MNLAVIGSGGREHAISHKLKQSPKVKKIICIPGNAGTQEIGENIKEDISNFDALYKIIKEKNIDITKYLEIVQLNGSIDLDPFKKKCLIEGLDDISLSLEKSEKIVSFEKKLKISKPWIFND